MKPGNLRDNVRCQHLQTRKGLDDKGETENRQNSRKHVSMRPFLVKGRFFCWLSSPNFESAPAQLGTE